MSRIELAKYRLERAKEILIESKDNFMQKHYKLSANRSYYAMFSATKALLALKELDARTHAGVILLFNQHFVKNGIFPKELSKLLPKAKNIREDADYRDFVEISKQDAEHQIKNAERFINQAAKRYPPAGGLGK